MTMPQSTNDTGKTCETCRFINYTRHSGDKEPVTDIVCANGELIQRAEGRTPDNFRPPRLAFSCNRWAARQPDLGFTPHHLKPGPTEFKAVDPDARPAPDYEEPFKGR